MTLQILSTASAASYARRAPTAPRSEHPTNISVSRSIVSQSTLRSLARTVYPRAFYVKAGFSTQLPTLAAIMHIQVCSPPPAKSTRIAMSIPRTTLLSSVHRIAVKCTGMT